MINKRITDILFLSINLIGLTKVSCQVGYENANVLEIITAKFANYHNCSGDCNFCIKDDHKLKNLNPQMGNDLDYQFMCDYELHLISYKGKYSLYNVGGSFSQLGMVSNCTSFAKSMKLKLEEKIHEACFLPFTKLNSMSAGHCQCNSTHHKRFVPQIKRSITCSGHCDYCLSSNSADIYDKDKSTFSYDCSAIYDKDYRDKYFHAKEAIVVKHISNNASFNFTSLGTTEYMEKGCNLYFEKAYNKTNMIQHLPGDACFKAYPQINTPIDSCHCNTKIDRMIPTLGYRKISCGNASQCNFCINDQIKTNENTIKVQGLVPNGPGHVYACNGETYVIILSLDYEENTIFHNIHGNKSCLDFSKDFNMTVGHLPEDNKIPNECFAWFSTTTNPKDCSCDQVIWHNVNDEN